MSPAEARLKEVPSEMTEAEWNQRVNLAACYRLVAHYGWDDLVDTHISARVPGPEHHFLINPYGLMFDEITASSLVKVDLDGNQLTKSQYSINPAGFTIHSAIHEVREDAGCVLHLHTPDGTAVASCMEGLLPMNQTAQLVTHDLAYHDYEGIALDHDERPRLQKDLGNKNHMLLRNHGTLTVGRSVASAFERMFHLERACTMQVRTRMLGPTAYPVEQAVIDKNTSVFANPDRAELRSTDAGMAAAAAQARPARSQLQELKFPEIRCSIAANNLCTSLPKRRPIPGGVFILRKPLVPACWLLCLRRVGERGQNSRPRADALVKAPQIILLVRRMDVVVFQAEPHHHGVEAEGTLEIGDDRDRCA